MSILKNPAEHLTETIQWADGGEVVPARRKNVSTEGNVWYVESMHAPKMEDRFVYEGDVYEIITFGYTSASATSSTLILRITGQKIRVEEEALADPVEDEDPDR
jgi:hypothetical protein